MNSLIVASGASQQGVTMSSREIADLTGSRHDAVRKSAERLATDQILTSPLAALDYEHRGNTYQEYRFNKRDSLVLVARLSPEFTAAVVDRWQELESRQHVALPDMNTDEGKLILIQQLAAKSLSLIEENKRVATERDSAIATKALIGSKREATAMAKASAAVRKVRQLEGQLGFNSEHATVIAVERATGRKFPRNTYVNLRRWCLLNGIQPTAVADPRYGSVKAWPAGAWIEHEGVDLKKLFSQESV